MQIEALLCISLILETLVKYLVAINSIIRRIITNKA